MHKDVLPQNIGDVRDKGQIPGITRSPGGGHGRPLQYSCLVNPIDRGAWWITVHRVTKSGTQLKQLIYTQKHVSNIMILKAFSLPQESLALNLFITCPIDLYGCSSFASPECQLELYSMQLSRIYFSHFSQFSHSVMSNSLLPHGLKHTRLPCPSPTPGASSNSCPSSK